MNRAYSLLSIDTKSFDDEQRVFKGIASTPRPDRVDDVVEPLGAVFSLPMPLLLDHDSRSAVGHVEFARPTKAGIPFEARIVKFDEPGEVKNLVDKAWHLVKTRLRPAVSIGFRALKDGVERMDNGGVKYNSWEWLELSLVVIPANADAVVFAKSLDDALDEIKSIDTALLAASGKKQIGAIRLLPPGVTGASPTKDQSPPGVSGVPQARAAPGASEMSTKTIADQINSFEQLRAAKEASMQEIQAKAIEDGRTKDAAEKETWATLADEIEAIDQELADLRRSERIAAAKATPVGEVKNAIDAATVRAGSIPAQPIKTIPHREKGIDFARYAMCVAAGKGNLMQSLEIAKSRYGDNDDVTAIVKAAVNAGTTTDTNWAGALVEAYPRFTGDFVEFLRPMTVVGKFGTNGIPGLRRVPFNVSIAGQTSGGNGYWVGEGQPKPLTRFDFTTFNLRWAKVAAISVLTEELIRFSNPAAETLVRDQLAAALIERLDIDFLDPNKAEVTNVSPASITNGVTPVASTGNNADAIREDVRLLMAPYIAANMSMASGVWIMSASIALSLSLMYNALGQLEFPTISMTGGTFVGLPVIVTEYATSDSNGHDIVLVSAQDIWLADDGQVTVDASREASLQMLDDPTNNSGTATPTTMVSLWQTNAVGLRAERFINWKKRRAQSVQMLGNVNWGEPGSS